MDEKYQQNGEQSCCASPICVKLDKTTGKLFNCKKCEKTSPGPSIGEVENFEILYRVKQQIDQGTGDHLLKALGEGKKLSLSNGGVAILEG